MKRIVILGGGFGGLYTAVNLDRLLRRSDEASITLISRDNFFVMTPLLFEAGSGVLEPRHAVNPIRTLFRKVHFVQAEIQRIDLDTKQIEIRIEGGDEQQVEYDQLVIALGATTNTSLIPGAAEHAMTFKTLGDAIHLRNHAIQRVERADVAKESPVKRSALTFVVVGAGLVGVELIGELTEFLPNVARLYRNVDKRDIELHLIEAGPRVAPEFEETMSAYIAKVLSGRGVRLHVATTVEQIESARVLLKGGEMIRSETIIAATGVIPAKLVATLPVAKSRKGAIVVDASLRVKDRPGVWALGDCASIPSPDGKPYPPLAQHALREAKVLSRNILRTLRQSGEPEQFVYETRGLLAALGHYNGVGRIGRLRLKGFAAWWVWRSYYLFQMPQWSRRIRIMIDWTVALLFRNDVVQLDLMRERATQEDARNDKRIA